MLPENRPTDSHCASDTNSFSSLSNMMTSFFFFLLQHVPRRQTTRKNVFVSSLSSDVFGPSAAIIHTARRLIVLFHTRGIASGTVVHFRFTGRRSTQWISNSGTLSTPRQYALLSCDKIMRTFCKTFTLSRFAYTKCMTAAAAVHLETGIAIPLYDCDAGGPRVGAISCVPTLDPVHPPPVSPHTRFTVATPCRCVFSGRSVFGDTAALHYRSCGTRDVIAFPEWLTSGRRTDERFPWSKGRPDKSTFIVNRFPAMLKFVKKKNSFFPVFKPDESRCR